MTELSQITFVRFVAKPLNNNAFALSPDFAGRADTAIFTHFGTQIKHRIFAQRKRPGYDTSGRNSAVFSQINRPGRSVNNRCFYFDSFFAKYIFRIINYRGFISDFLAFPAGGQSLEISPYFRSILQENVRQISKFPGLDLFFFGRFPGSD